jgi:hypothetical protein
MYSPRAGRNLPGGTAAMETAMCGFSSSTISFNF